MNRNYFFYLVIFIFVPAFSLGQVTQFQSTTFYYQRSTRSCHGYNPFLGECFENSKINRLSGDFKVLNLNGSKMNYITIIASKFEDLQMNGTSLVSAKLARVNAKRLFAQYAQLRGVSISSSEIKNFSFFKSNLSGSKISNVKFVEGDFDKVNFQDAMITDCTFRNVRLPKTVLTEAQMINVQFHDVVWVDKEIK